MKRLIISNIRRKKLYYKLIFGFIIMALVPIALTICFINFQYENDMLEELNKTNYKLLEQAKLNVDSALNEMEQSASAIIANPDLPYFMKSGYVNDPYSFNNLIAQVASIPSNSRYISGAYIIFDSFDYVIEANGGINGIAPVDEVSDSSWYRSYKQFGMLGENSILTHDSSNGDIVWIRFVLNQTYKRVGAIVVTISRDTLKNIIADSYTTSLGSVIVADNIYPFLYLGDPYFPSNDSGESLIGLDDGTHELRISGDMYFVKNARSKVSNWTFISVVPKTKLVQSINLFKQLTVLLLLMIIFGIGISSMYYSKYLYSPIYRLLSSIQNKQQTLVGPEDEIKTIDLAYRNILLNVNRLEQVVEKNKHLMRNKFLYLATMGEEMEEEDIQEKLDYLEIAFPNPFFVVYLVQIVKMKMDDVQTYKHLATNKSAVIAVAQEMVDDFDLDGYPLDMNTDSIAVILNFGADKLDIAEQFASRLKAVMDSHQGFGTKVSMGTMVNRFEDICHSYQYARKIISMGRADLDADKSTEIDEQYIAFGLYEKKICHALLMKDEVGMTQRLSEMMEVIQCRQMDWPKASNNWMRLLAASLRTLEDKNPILFQEISSEPVFSDLLSLYTANDVREWFQSFFTFLIHRMAEHEEQHQIHQKVEMVKKIIKEQYVQDISLEGIAGEVGLNPTYLSTIFKQQTGTNFIDYVNKTRIEMSKGLLIEKTSLSLQKIAEKVGYRNTQSFTRFFKKYESCTPGQFRQIHA